MRNSIYLFFVAGLLLVAAASYYLFLNDAETESVEPSTLITKPTLSEQQENNEESTNGDEPSASKEMKVEDYRHLSDENIASVDVKLDQKEILPKTDDDTINRPKELVVYQADESSQRKANYTINQYDQSGNRIGQIDVVDETILPNGQMAVTLALPEGGFDQKVVAVPNAESRGYAIDLDNWDYADISLPELILMFDKGDKVAGMQIGHLLIEQNKIEQSESYLAACAKATGFSRPLDMLSNAYFAKGLLIKGAAWGVMAADLSGFDDWSHRIRLHQDDKLKVQQQYQTIKQEF